MTTRENTPEPDPSAPLLAEQLGGVPDDPTAAARFLEAIYRRTEARAGREVMDQIRESVEDIRCGKDGLEPFE